MNVDILHFLFVFQLDIRCIFAYELLRPLCEIEFCPPGVPGGPFETCRRLGTPEPGRGLDVATFCRLMTRLVGTDAGVLVCASINAQVWRFSLEEVSFPVS